MGGREEEDYPDEVEERLINEEYKIWKKNTPFLYGGTQLAASAILFFLIITLSVVHPRVSPRLRRCCRVAPHARMTGCVVPSSPCADGLNIQGFHAVTCSSAHCS
jgi:hypothetical protein